MMMIYIYVYIYDYEHCYISFFLFLPFFFFRHCLKILAMISAVVPVFNEITIACF